MLPDWPDALELVRSAHRAIPELVFVGWDIAFTPTGPVIVEANHDPDVNILQRSQRRPLGESRFAELIAHYLAGIDGKQKLERSLRATVSNFMKEQPFISFIRGLYCEREVDAFVVSFPKCGRTWLRVQLGRVMEQHFGLEVEDLIEMREIAARTPGVPKLRFLHPDHPERKRPHELSKGRIDFFRFRKVVLLVRDPRDVVVSMYMHRTKRGMKPRFDGTLSEFLDEAVGGFDTIMEFYNCWAERQGLGSRVLIVRYEDMHADPHKELRRVVDFLGLRDASQEVIDEAVAFSSFDNMKEMERADRFGNSKLRPQDANDPESFKVRKGQIGGYHDYLSDAEVSSLEKRMRKSLRAYYEAPAAENPRGV